MMIHFNNKAIDYVKRITIISNTPAFLYNRIRQSDYTLKLATTYTSKELFSELKKISNKKNHTSFDLSIVYTLLAALSLKGDFDLRKLKEINLSWVEWAKEIVSILNMNSYRINYIEINGSLNEYIQDNVVNNSSSTNEKTINIASVKQRVKQYEI